MIRVFLLKSLLRWWKNVDFLVEICNNKEKEGGVCSMNNYYGITQPSPSTSVATNEGFLA